MPVAGLLLAAGAGRRMGGPKALLRDEDGVPFVDRALCALTAGGCDQVTVVLGAADQEVTRVLLERGHLDSITVRLAMAHDWIEGMGASLRAGLKALPAEAESVVVTLVDLPDVGGPVVRRLLARSAQGPSVLSRAAYGGRPGHPVLLGRQHWRGVEAKARGDQGARAYLATHDVALIDCSDLATGCDVDRPDQRSPSPRH